MYILFMTFATLLSWVAWAVVLWSMNPEETGPGGFLIFYVTLFMGLLGTLTLFGVTYRVMFLGRRDVVSREVRISFRHAIALSAMAVAALALSAQGLLRWWIAAILIAVVSVIEYLFLVKEEARRV